MTLNQYLNYLVKWIKDYVDCANAKGILVGISGGVDSALVAALAVRACKENTLGVSINIYNSKLDQETTKIVQKNTKIKLITVNLEKTFNTMTEELIKNEKLLNNNKSVLGNLKARLRMCTLYSYAQLNGYLVLGTDNADEYYTGYFTKYGDGGADLLPIVKLTKSQVREAAKILGIDEKVYNRVPTASLYVGQTDENEMGFSYDELDAHLLMKKIKTETIKKIEHLHKISEHKRQEIPKPRCFSKLIK